MRESRRIIPINNRIAKLSEEAAVWRRDFHSNPELLFDLPRTSTLVAERLRAFGVDRVETRIGRVGVVGVIEGSRGAGPTIGLRADMDALPILEATGKTYASQSPGRMHACGHDGHTAMLLGAARYLAETRNFAGRAIVVFQPAEEGGDGAKEMVEAGLMEQWYRGDLRPTQLPWRAGGRFRHSAGAAHGGQQPVPHHNLRSSRSCRLAARLP